MHMSMIDFGEGVINDGFAARKAIKHTSKECGRRIQPISIVH